MAYSKTTWKDAPDSSTPINATNLNKIEKGLVDAHTAMDKIVTIPATANEGDILKFKGGKWVAEAP